MNDLTEFISHAYEDLNRVSNMAHLSLSDDDTEVYFKLFLLLYADATVIFAENELELQAALNAMFLCCKSWDLEVNPAKTKITIFSNKKLNNVPRFKYDGHDLEVEDSFLLTIVVFLKMAKGCWIRLVKLCFLFFASQKSCSLLLTYN